MNTFKATISQITTTKELSLVDLKVGTALVSMVGLRLDSSLYEGKEVLLGAKSTTISLAKAETPTEDMTFSNQLPAVITKVDSGEILSSVILDFMGYELESIITTRSLKRLSFSEGETVVALIKASSLSILEMEV